MKTKVLFIATIFLLAIACSPNPPAAPTATTTNDATAVIDFMYNALGKDFAVVSQQMADLNIESEQQDTMHNLGTVLVATNKGVTLQYDTKSRIVTYLNINMEVDSEDAVDTYISVSDTLSKLPFTSWELLSPDTKKTSDYSSREDYIKALKDGKVNKDNFYTENLLSVTGEQRRSCTLRLISYGYYEGWDINKADDYDNDDDDDDDDDEGEEPEEPGEYIIETYIACEMRLRYIPQNVYISDTTLVFDSKRYSFLNYRLPVLTIPERNAYIADIQVECDRPDLLKITGLNGGVYLSEYAKLINVRALSVGVATITLKNDKVESRCVVTIVDTTTTDAPVFNTTVSDCLNKQNMSAATNNGSNGDEYSEYLSIKAIGQGNYIFVHHIVDNCCAELKGETLFSKSTATIYIKETNTSDDAVACNCICPYNITATATGVADGKYNIRLGDSRRIALIEIELNEKTDTIIQPEYTVL